MDILAENRITLENTAFYQLMPENSDRRHCSCQALSLCKKARRKLMHLSLRLAFYIRIELDRSNVDARSLQVHPDKGLCFQGLYGF